MSIETKISKGEFYDLLLKFVREDTDLAPRHGLAATEPKAARTAFNVALVDSVLVLGHDVVL